MTKSTRSCKLKLATESRSSLKMLNYLFTRKCDMPTAVWHYSYRHAKALNRANFLCLTNIKLCCRLAPFSGSKKRLSA